MGILATSIAPASGAVQGAQQASTAARTDQIDANNTSQTVKSNPAAIVSISTATKTRGASSGDSRSVDAAFEKQESQAGKNQKNDSSARSDGKGVVLDVQA